MLRAKSIFCISSIDWDFIWQGHQEIMATLSAQGNLVLFMENTGVRRPTFRDLPRLRQRIRNWRRGVMGFREEQENLFVYSPVVFPFPYSRPARWANRALLVRSLRRWMRATGFGRPIIWTFLPTPLARDLIRELDPLLTVYYCIDDLASSSLAARRIRWSEAQLFREADLVFVTSEKLRERAARFRDQVSVFPFGVDYRMFEAIRAGPDEVPEELRKLGGPVAGYVGGVHQWVDLELLAAVARRLPEVSFALVGPLQTDVSRLAECPNVHLLGGRPHGEMARYLKGFQVGLIPYRLTEYTANVYPTKLNEYLAMGLPVVASDLPEIQRFNAEHGQVVAVAGGPEAFAEAIRAAIERSSPAEVERRIEVAQRNSWEARMARMSELIEEALAVRRTAGRRWEETLRRLYRTARRRIVRTAAGVIAAYLLLSYTPVVWWVAEPLRVTAPPRPADAIVVLGGGVGESGRIGRGFQERVTQAVELYREGRASRILFSSPHLFFLREVEVMRDLSIARGVPASSIIVETRAVNTYQMVAFIKEILQQKHWRSILLVSSPYHMRRALLTWRKVAPEIQVHPAPVPESQFYAHRLGATIEQTAGILQEYLAILVYWWRGWI
jgi:uncharacterized SAM-binding protein YcdF (DUF218 family)/glycosyltransferase involved in cell wall biosynthesis